MRSPGLCSSTHALIFSNLRGEREMRMTGTKGQRGRVPLVLLADVVLFAEVDKVDDGLRSKQLEAVDDVDLVSKR